MLEFLEMIDMWVTMLDDYFESTDLKALGKVYKENASYWDGIKESYPELNNSSKLELSSSDFNYRVCDVYPGRTTEKSCFWATPLPAEKSLSASGDDEGDG